MNTPEESREDKLLAGEDDVAQGMHEKNKLIFVVGLTFLSFLWPYQGLAIFLAPAVIIYVLIRRRKSEFKRTRLVCGILCGLNLLFFLSLLFYQIITK